jgi:hypothetical protein
MNAGDLTARSRVTFNRVSEIKRLLDVHSGEIPSRGNMKIVFDCSGERVVFKVERTLSDNQLDD